jgi:hypothetical protein
MWVQDFTVLFVAIAPQVWPTMSVLNMLMKVSTAQPPSELRAAKGRRAIERTRPTRRADEKNKSRTSY